MTDRTLGRMDAALGRARRAGVTPLGLAAGLGLVGMVIAARLLPHQPNFTPLAAVALFAGFLFPRAWMGLAAAWLALAISDAFIGLYHPLVMVSVYLSAAFPILLRRLVRRPAMWRVAACSLTGAVVFFVVTNFAVWLAAPSSVYAATPAGLAACYAAALPFFKFTLAGDAMWALALFGSHALVLRAWATWGSRRSAAPSGSVQALAIRA
ncbi:MAG: DUF6580 family putative transport protein [Phycisphaerales bacterium]